MYCRSVSDKAVTDKEPDSGQRVLGPVKVTLHCRAETPELGLMLTSFSPKGFRFLSLVSLLSKKKEVNKRGRKR